MDTDKSRWTVFMKITELPDDILQHIFLYSSFYPLHALGFDVEEVLKRLRLQPKKAGWVWEDTKNRYIPFRYSSRESTCAVLHIQGSVFPSSSDGWKRFSSNIYSPAEYQTYFRDKATPDMVPRIHPNDDPQIDISYRGRRSPQPPLALEEGREVDVMDSLGEWWKGSMVTCQDNRTLYHFEGWDSKWDQWYPNDSLHVAPLHSITQDWRLTLRVDDMLDFKHQGQWYEARISALNKSTVWVHFYKYRKPETEEVQLSSERLMFYGAHTWSYRSPFRVSNVTWKDREGTEIYQYRFRGSMGSKTVLVDRLLSEAESQALFSETHL